MTHLDGLLAWPVTTAELEELMAREEWARPNEGLHFEHKSDLNTDRSQVPKTVAAFANAEGGYLFIGTTTTNGVLSGIPGVDPAEQEWPLLISNLIINNVSPLPSWRVVSPPTPDDSGRVVTVVRVEPSSEPPHVVGGRIYVRTPGGASEPIKDRATLDRLVERGAEGHRASEARLVELEVAGPNTEAAADDWRFVAVLVPVPFGSAPRKGLLTRSGFGAAATGFAGELLGADRLNGPMRMFDDGVEITFNLAIVRAFEDGATRVSTGPAGPFGQGGEDEIEIPRLIYMLKEALQNEASRGVGEVDVLVKIANPADARAAMVRPGTVVMNYSAPKPLPKLWRARFRTATTPTAITQALERLEARIWRAAGDTSDRAFDPR